MLYEILFLAIIVALIVKPWGRSEGHVGAREEEAVGYEVVAFGKNAPRSVSRGEMSAEHFRKCFKSDHAVTSARGEIPEDAAAFGVIVLTSGSEITTLPFYTWNGGKRQHFACQGERFGRAPMFMIRERSEEAFFQAVKKQLATSE